MRASSVSYTMIVGLAGALCMVAVLGVSHASDELDRLQSSETEISVKFPESPLTDVLEMLSKAGGFELELAGRPPEGKVSVIFEKTTVKEVLVDLRDRFGLAYSVPSPEKLVVRFPERDPGSGQQPSD